MTGKTEELAWNQHQNSHSGKGVPVTWPRGPTCLDPTISTRPKELTWRDLAEGTQPSRLILFFWGGVRQQRWGLRTFDSDHTGLRRLKNVDDGGVSVLTGLNWFQYKHLIGCLPITGHGGRLAWIILLKKLNWFWRCDVMNTWSNTWLTSPCFKIRVALLSAVIRVVLSSSNYTHGFKSTLLWWFLLRSGWKKFPFLQS